ncbi:MAG: 3-deoxy-manno-octulosonate cytidylyltransferase [Pseudomonadota bacterium]
MAEHFHIVIPARMASTRLPGKPVTLLDDKTLIEHVWRRAIAVDATSVVIATDSPQVADVASGFGADVAMTDPAHQSGTDRVAEVARQRDWQDDLVINVQGDEPFIPLSAIRQVVTLLRDDATADIATLSAPISDDNQWQDPNCVKVISDRAGRALVFTRAPVPYRRHNGGHPAQRHIGIYGYKAASLHALVAEPPCALELTESLEQLRALWIGQTIVVAEAVDVPPPGIDTPADLAAARALLSEQAT